MDIKLKNDDIIRRHKEAGVLFEVAKRYKFVGNVMMLTSLVLSLSIPVEDKNLYTRRDPRLPILACGVSIGLICSISANYKINKMHHLLFYY